MGFIPDDDEIEHIAKAAADVNRAKGYYDLTWELVARLMARIRRDEAKRKGTAMKISELLAKLSDDLYERSGADTRHGGFAQTMQHRTIDYGLLELSKTLQESAGKAFILERRNALKAVEIGPDFIKE